MKNILIITFLFIVNITFSQVYNYLPMSYANIETNPSYVASNKSPFLTSVSHLNNFQANNKFYLNNMKISKYFDNYFSGIGLNISNTNMYDTIKYNHIGLSMAYRNIFFDKIYVRLGLNYKIIDITAPQGVFRKYNFDANNDISRKNTTQNFNTSITVSSSQEWFYATIGFLNITPSWVKKNNYFPSYTYLKAGNFWKLFNAHSSKDLSLLVFNESYNSESNFSYNISFFNIYTFNRNTQIKYGGEIGYNDSNYINLKPTLLYPKYLGIYRKNNKVGTVNIKLSVDFAININSFKQVYKPSYIFSILYNI